MTSIEMSSFIGVRSSWPNNPYKFTIVNCVYFNCYNGICYHWSKCRERLGLHICYNKVQRRREIVCEYELLGIMKVTHICSDAREEMKVIDINIFEHLNEVVR